MMKLIILCLVISFLVYSTSGSGDTSTWKARLVIGLIMSGVALLGMVIGMSIMDNYYRKKVQ